MFGSDLTRNHGRALEEHEDRHHRHRHRPDAVEVAVVEVDRDVVGDAAVLDLLAAVPAEQVDHRRVGAVVVPRAVQREVAHHRGVVLDRGDEPQPVAQVVQPTLRVGGRRWRKGLGEQELDLFEHRFRVDAVDDHVLVQHLLVDVGVGGFLADETPHVVGQPGDPSPAAAPR